MPKIAYNYLEEGDISVEAPATLLSRVDRNFEEVPVETGVDIPNIRASEGEFVTFNRDRSKKYLETRPNHSREYEGFDFLRYGVCVSSLWMRDSTHYEVSNFLQSDESGILKCFKKVYYGLGRAEDKVLVHGSLIEIEGQGILITGECWSGKTSLVLSFLEHDGAKFISDGNTLLSFKDGQLIGHYLPRPVYTRFAALNSNPRLRSMLSNPSEAEAIQPFDKEAIEEIIATRRYDVDGGLNISRKKFLELMGVDSIPLVRISRIINTHFDDSPDATTKPLDINDMYRIITSREFPKEIRLGNVQHQRDIECPSKSLIIPEWFGRIRGVAVHFDARKNLTPLLLEALVR